MKNFKKLSILLLSLVMAFSCLALCAFAEENEEAAKIAEIESLLEYYDDEGIYICDTFDGSGTGAVIFFDPTSAGEYAELDGRNVWTATQDGFSALFSPDLEIKNGSENVAFVYTFCVDADAENADKGYLAMEFSGSSTSVANSDAQSVLVFDYNEGKAYFAAMDANVVLSSVEVADFVPENGVWYTIELVYTTKTNSFEGRIVAEGAEYPVAYRLDGMASLSTVALRSRNLGNEGVTTSWDVFEMYEGSFIRSNFAGCRQAYLDTVLLTYMKAYAEDETAQDVKGAIVSTVDALVARGYVPSAGSETEEYFNKYFDTSMIEYYWDQFANGVGAIDTSLKYNARMAYIQSVKALTADFPVRPAGVSVAVYEAAIEAYNAEVAALGVIAEYSEVLLEAVREPVDEMKYDALLNWILNFEAAREALLRQDGSYDDTYYGVDIAIDIYEEAADRLSALKLLAVQFIEAVDAMNMSYATDFGVKYAAYMLAYGITSDPEFAAIVDSFTADLYFIDNETLCYDGREYTFEVVDGKNATVTINNMPYTLTLADYVLYLEGEGVVVSFAPVGSNSGVEFKGVWTIEQTLAQAYEKFELRDDAIIAGRDYCKAFMDAVSEALFAKGYELRVVRRDEILSAYADQRSWYEEGGKYFGFEGLADSLAALDAFCAQIDLDKANADKYIEIVSGLATAATYEEIKAIIDEATPYSAVGNVDGYPGIQEINMLFDANKAIVVEAEGNAVIFAGYVNDAAIAEDLATRLAHLRSAQAVYAKLIDGATGVAEAKELFAAEKDRYLADASAMNTSVEEQSEALVQVALATVKAGVPEKVVFIIKKIYEI